MHAGRHEGVKEEKAKERGCGGWGRWKVQRGQGFTSSLRSVQGEQVHGMVGLGVAFPGQHLAHS